MFADDTNITVPGCTFAELEQATNSELTNLYSWLKANKLSLNIAKTEFMVVSSRQKFLAENCSELNIRLDNQPISRVEHAKSLGLIIDDRLSWSNYIKELCRKISSPIGALRRIRFLISQSTAVQIYNALIQPHFDYCAPVWDGLSSYLCEKLQKLQNRTAMGSPVFVAVAKIIMQNIKEQALSTYNEILPLWLSYVDDTITAVHKNKIAEFQEHLNKQNTSIQFTKEIVKNGKIPFPDCLVTRENSNRRTTVYKKPINTH